MNAAPENSVALPEWGPKMLALNERQRAFVVALYSEDAPRKGDGRMIYAAREAGYGSPEGSTNKVLSVISNRLLHDDKVQQAMSEYSRGMARAIAPEAIAAVRELIRDPKARDHARAIAMIIDRVAPIESHVNVDVHHHDDPASIKATREVLDRIEELARSAGIGKLPQVIDADFVEVVP